MKFTKERLEEIAEDGFLKHGESKELARIALASLEAEAVCYLTWHQGFRAPDDCEEYVVEAKPGDKSCDGSPAFPVYAAPPVTVSVPDLTALDNLAGEMLNHAMNCERRVAVAYTHCAHRLAEEVRDLRAAMLNQEKSNG
jgi:hypothetical protein